MTAQPGTVGDTCDRPRCRKPVELRYLGVDLCATHWRELCERTVELLPHLFDELAEAQNREIDENERVEP